MAEPRFHLGDHVHVRPDRQLGTMVGLYEVTAVLPEFQNRQRYRVRYYGSFIEQVIEETDLSPAKVMTPVPPEAAHEHRACLHALRQRRYMQGAACHHRAAVRRSGRPVAPKPLLRSAAVLDPTSPSVISMVQFGSAQDEPAKLLAVVPARSVRTVSPSATDRLCRWFARRRAPEMCSRQ